MPLSRDQSEFTETSLHLTPELCTFTTWSHAKPARGSEPIFRGHKHLIWQLMYILGQ